MTPLSVVFKQLHGIRRAVGNGLLVVSTPLVEKNPAKTLAARAPVVLSMARVIVLAFAVAVIRRLWRVGIAGWPDATLSIAIVLALPIVAALERVRPQDVVGLAKTLVSRFGHGDVGASWSNDAQEFTEPSKFDDHRSDAVVVTRESEVERAEVMR